VFSTCPLLGGKDTFFLSNFPKRGNCSGFQEFSFYAVSGSARFSVVVFVVRAALALLPRLK
jgi:hypothetical protein